MNACGFYIDELPSSTSLYANEWFGAKLQIAELPTTECPRKTGVLFFSLGFSESSFLSYFSIGIRWSVNKYSSFVTT